MKRLKYTNKNQTQPTNLITRWMGQQKKSLKVSSTNIRGLNTASKREAKIHHLIDHLDSNVKIIIDAHATENTVNILKKEFKLKLAKYNITGNYSKDRGIIILLDKTSGYEISNLEPLDQTNTIPM